MDNTIGYIDSVDKTVYIEAPLTIMQNQFAVNRFGPKQACYIGILAGLALERPDKNGLSKNEVILAAKKTSILRLV